MTDTILYTSSGHIGRLVLNNPQKHNSLGREQLEGISACLRQVASDELLRVLIVTGNGEKTFCAGASLQELNDGTIGDDAFQKMTDELASVKIPTLCALNGNVFGGGVELALSCDFRIGVTGMRMRVPAAAIGLCYPLSGIKRFVGTLGVQIARRILVACEEFESDELLACGILDKLVAPDTLNECVQEMAEHLAGLAPLAVQSMKGILQEAMAVGVDAQRANDLAALCLESSDLQEGFAAKREKRQPVFRGK